MLCSAHWIARKKWRKLNCVITAVQSLVIHYTGAVNKIFCSFSWKNYSRLSRKSSLPRQRSHSANLCLLSYCALTKVKFMDPFQVYWTPKCEALLAQPALLFCPPLLHNLANFPHQQNTRSDISREMYFTATLVYMFKLCSVFKSLLRPHKPFLQIISQ